MHSRFLLPILALALACTTTAQPTWRFHLAFEDGTGARDTLWLLYDTTATLPVDPWPGPNVDYELGEGPTDMSNGLFHVFTRNANWDSTNTVAFPYSWYPIFETGNTIDAIKWVPPMTITWDTSLFHALYLPYNQGLINQAYLLGDYFFFHSNDGSGIGYNMLITNNVVMDEGSQFLFPFGILFSGDGSTIGVTESTQPEVLGVWPNPATRWLNFPLDGQESKLIVFDNAGHSIHTHMIPPSAASHAWDVSLLGSGTYHIVMVSSKYPPRHATFEKVD